MKPYKYSVFIGRFQPFHFGHLLSLKFAESISENIIVLIGSSFYPRTIKNPFTFEERREHLLSVIQSENIHTHVSIIPLEDYPYSNNTWIATVQEKVNNIVKNSSDKISIVGAEKDASSSFLRWFPSWVFEHSEYDKSSGLHATKIRDIFFSEENPLYFKSALPSSVYSFIESYRNKDWWNELKTEFSFIQKYKKSWESAPYKPTFVTVDAVVFQCGYILLVERKSYPGKGLLALPGGFIKENETLEEGMIRELKEETSIKVPIPVILGSIRDRKVFDSPERSLRGRTITHAFYIQFPNSNPLPKIKGGDDAKHCFWVPLSDIKKETLFEDHWDIIMCNGFL